MNAKHPPLVWRQALLACLPMDDTGGSNSASTDASGAERDAWRLQLFAITRVLCEEGGRGTIYGGCLCYTYPLPTLNDTAVAGTVSCSMETTNALTAPTVSNGLNLACTPKASQAFASVQWV